MKIIYPGTFDPFSMGHYDMVKRASDMFEHVYIAVSENKHKKPMFSLKDRVEIAKLAVTDISNASVEGFSTLLVDYMAKKDVNCVLRGIRGLVDFDYEFQMAQLNRSMRKNYEPIFLMPSEKYMVLSSSMIREVISLGGDISQYLHPAASAYLKKITL